MKLQKCEMCGKAGITLVDHHIIPWWLSHDDSENNVMRLCSKCHGKADGNFISLILYGKTSISGTTRRRVGCRYSKKYIKMKQLYSIRLLKRTRYYDTLKYNTKIDSIIITQRWQYFPNKHHTYASKTSRRTLAKAARSTGQITLG